MKTIKNTKAHLVFALIALFFGSSFNTRAQQASVSFQAFYNELQPYGSWFSHPDYGYVWAPDVASDFVPYSTNGYWTVTQYGNTWVSNYDWGWAPFHYGRWYYDDFYGWIWVPDTVWAPAWVVWRNGGGYYGWAPLSPGLSFSLSFNIFNRIPNFYWTFCPQQYVWSSSWYGYCAPRYRNVYMVNNTTYVNNYYVNNSHHYYSGPSHRDISRVTNRQVHVRRVEDCERPNQNRIDRDKVILYRPIVKRGDNDRPSMDKKPRGNSYGWNNGNNPRGNNGNGNNPGNDNNGQGGNNHPGGNGGNNSDDNNDDDQGDGNNHPRGNGGNGNGGNNSDDDGGNGRPRENNGHGNGDQDAPGNSGGHNNGENSDNSGQGNSGNGKGGNKNQKENPERMSSSFSRTFPDERKIEQPSDNRSSQWSESRTRSFEPRTPGRTNNMEAGRNSTPQTMPDRSNHSRSTSSMNMPGRSNTNSRSAPSMNMPSRSNSRGNSNMNVPRSSGSTSTVRPGSSSHSSGSRSTVRPSAPSRSSGPRSISPKRKN